MEAQNADGDKIAERGGHRHAEHPAVKDNGHQQIQYDVRYGHGHSCDNRQLGGAVDLNKGHQRGQENDGDGTQHIAPQIGNRQSVEGRIRAKQRRQGV